MKSVKNKLIAVIGPTASGKSDCAIRLAKKLHTDVISVDSRQVYKGMNIGSAKVEGHVDKKEYINIDLDGKKKKVYPFISEGVKHWMIDVANPVKDIYTLADFQDTTYQIIFKLFSQGKVPILCGGSALYMDAVLKGFQIPKTSPKIREELEKFSTEELLAELKKSDPDSYKKVDKKNRRRIVRALESFLVNRTPHLAYKIKQPKFDYLLIGLNWPRHILYQRIDKRVDERIKQGMIEEVQGLHQQGISYKKLYDFGLEYRFCGLYLKNELTRSDMIQKIKYKIHAFVRRQLTWWRKNKDINWFDFSDDNVCHQVHSKVDEFLK